jgi:hypothetical protein
MGERLVRLFGACQSLSAFDGINDRYARVTEIRPSVKRYSLAARPGAKNAR